MIEGVRAADGISETRTGAPPIRLHEDWLAVVLGGVVLAAALAGVIPTLPSLRWGGDIALWSLFTPDVLVSWVAAGVGVGALGAGVGAGGQK